MSKVHKTYIPAVGSSDAKVMCVGEAGGKDEEREGEPFVGRSGQLQTLYWDRLGVKRSSMWLTNLSKYRPNRNKFVNLVGTPELEAGLSELREEILTVDPNLIVAYGGWPLYYLTGKCGNKPGSGITNWRGSVLPCTLVQGYKVLATYHPAYILRNWKWHPVFDFDLRRAKKEMADKDFHYPEYDIFLADNDASHPNYIDEGRLADLVGQMGEAPWLEVDIETFPDRTMSCCGFSDGPGRTLIITFRRPGGWKWVRDLMASEARKIFQFGTYDATFMQRFYNFSSESFYVQYEGWGREALEIRNHGWDTYVAAATLMPEFPRGLDFLTSVYTNFPYYKEDRKEWKTSQDLNILWEYNAKDNIAEYITAAKQMREIESQFGFAIPDGTPYASLPEE